MLILIPTYNEQANVGPMCSQLIALGLDADILFMDDNSPDGTGQVLDVLAAEHPRVQVLHRPGKLGIGSAHLDGIAWAYDHGYQTLVTMDCDFSHTPADIVRLLEQSDGYDVIVASRWANKGSLPGWSLMRRFLTKLGHFCTRRLLGMPYDATGAFRVYHLDNIPRAVFSLVTARGYAFFFESLFLLNENRCRINQVPIVLPARVCGHSKMRWRDAFRSLWQMTSLAVTRVTNPGQFQAPSSLADVDPLLIDPQGWDAYWDKKSRPSNKIYELIATLYRTQVIRRRLNRAILSHFPPGSQLLHAGCGSGQVDAVIQKSMDITALDISPSALRLYSKNNPRAAAIKHGDILALPFADNSFDGVYNLGVLEHFNREEIQRILAEFYRVLKPGGKVVLFWPHRHATSVMVLNSAHWFLNQVLKRNVQLHPPEISLLRSRRFVEDYLQGASFDMEKYYFGAKDFWVQAMIVAVKKATQGEAQENRAA
jgi:dolichol-phosphate mannosyltransferase